MQSKIDNIDIIKDISLLYELSLAIGTSLDVIENSKHFLSVLMRRKNLDFASVWWFDDIVNLEERVACQLVYAHPSFRVEAEELPITHPIFKRLETESFFVVNSNDPDFYAFEFERSIESGQFLFYKLGDVGFIKLYVNHLQETFTQIKNLQLKMIMEKFTVSLKACAAHSQYILEAERRKIIEEILGEKEAHYKMLVESAAEGLVITDLEGRFMFVNKQMVKLLGLPEEEIIGKHIYQIVMPKETQKTYVNRIETRKAGISESYELELIKPNGEIWWAFINAAPYRNKDGEIIGTVGGVIDITDKKKNEIQIKTNKKKLELIIESSLDAIISIDAKGAVVDWNYNAEKIFGYSKSEAIGNRLADLIIPNRMVDGHKKGMQRFMHTKKGHVLDQLIEMPARNKDGKEFPVEMSISFSELEGAFYFTAFLRDITKRKNNENDLIKAKRIAEQARNAERQFLAHMSHEIRTPMNAVIGMTYLLQDAELSAEQKGYVEALKYSADNLMVIISDILDLSKIEAGELVLEEKAFSLNEVFHNIETSYRANLLSRPVQLVVYIDPVLPTNVIGDATRIVQIISNLMSNACKFTESGYIRISVTPSTKITTEDKLWIQIEIEDTGIGIEAENLDKVFKSFKQASVETHGKFGGTGLGLSIVRQLVMLGGGEIGIKSKLEKGTTFTINMPFGIVNEETNRLIQKDGYHADSSHHVDLSKLKILIAEDNPINQKLISAIMQKWHCKFKLVGNGQLAFDAVSQEKFDLILMDINMPVMNGFDAIQKIRAEAPVFNKDIPIIALTAAALEEERRKMFLAGANDFITKPFSPQQLNKRIEDIIIQMRGKNGEYTFTEDLEQNFTRTSSLEFDLAYLLNFTGGDTSFAKEMISMFLEYNPINLKVLVDAYHAKDWEGMKSIAHQMKANLGMLGLQVLEENAKYIEQSIKKDLFVIEEYKEAVENLCAVLPKVYEALENTLKEL